VLIFVTGATGLVGSHAVEKMVGRGYRVRALVRPGADTRFLMGLGAELVPGDITDAEAALASAIEGCDAVVHGAALVFRRASEAVYHRLNVVAARNVFLAAAAAGASRVLHISSVAVYGDAGGARPIREDHWNVAPLPRHALYARSKRAAEEAAWELHESGRINLTVLRPVVVYGERDRLAVPVLDRLTRLPILPLPGGGSAPIPVAYAGNVADVIVAALERPVAIGRAYNVIEPRTISSRALLERFGRELGRKPRVLPLPAALVRAAATAGDTIASAIPGVAVTDVRRAARLLLDGIPYDTTRVTQDLDWTGRVDHDEAIRRTAAWWAGESLGRRRAV